MACVPPAWLLVGGALVLQALFVWLAWRQYRRAAERARAPHPLGCLCERCMPNPPRFG